MFIYFAKCRALLFRLLFMGVGGGGAVSNVKSEVQQILEMLLFVFYV